ncbi:MAG: hypothetical protein IJS00_01055 [Paludibacteraceae bacterium]|nr:hypothetical protein [Paludibacteraceae bacterium]
MISISKYLFLSLTAITVSVTSFCQSTSRLDTLLLPYNATTLTEEQRNSNPDYLAYPTFLQDQMPEIRCGTELEYIGCFSISPSRQVGFAPGNLQYCATEGLHNCADGTTAQGTWRFALHQWDRVGGINTYASTTVKGNVYKGDALCTNNNISSTYDGWIDLFGWATSGWDGAAEEYLPWAHSQGNDYKKWISPIDSMKGTYAYADWGQYNTIHSYQPGSWRTLTVAEWDYLLSVREDADQKKGKATVNGVEGIMLLPDVWQLPPELTFNAGMDNDFNANVYTESQWILLEREGAVFLPLAGSRLGSTVYQELRYWTATSGTINKNISNSDSYAYYIDYTATTQNVTYDYSGITNRMRGLSVRLAVDIDCRPPLAFSVSDHQRVLFSPGDLQFSAGTGIHVRADGTEANGTWRFALHQWDFVGDYHYGTVYKDGTKCDNSKISSTYSGWIDLFGWGNTGWGGRGEQWAYQPWDTRANDPYYACGNTNEYVLKGEQLSMTGNHLYMDWGQYLPIDDYQPGYWRTLTGDEWSYLLYHRTNAEQLRAHGQINNDSVWIHGFIILPDEWQLPEGQTFTPGSTLDYTVNSYTLENWLVMEQAGAVFLPCGGYRGGNNGGTSINAVVNNGDYWASTGVQAHGYYFPFYYRGFVVKTQSRCHGRSVRLVKDVDY